MYRCSAPPGVARREQGLWPPVTPEEPGAQGQRGTRACSPPPGTVRWARARGVGLRGGDTGCAPFWSLLGKVGVYGLSPGEAHAGWAGAGSCASLRRVCGSACLPRAESFPVAPPPLAPGPRMGGDWQPIPHEIALGFFNLLALAACPATLLCALPPPPHHALFSASLPRQLPAFMATFLPLCLPVHRFTGIVLLV